MSVTSAWIRGIDVAGSPEWLLGQAGDWLRSGGVAQVLDYASPDEPDGLAFLRHVGFTELTRTRRGWMRRG